MKNFTIIPLNINHIDEICEDIKYQIENKIADCPLFMVQLHPEGTPCADKAGIAAAKYALFREKLKNMNIPSGIHVQSSIGHGYPLSEDSPFKKYINLNDGKTETVCCPYDDDFCDYIRDAFIKLASTAPDIIMVDDDFRLIYRAGNGCACKMHMDAFNEKSKINFTREQLYDVLKKDGTGEVAKIYLETQHEALIKAAKAMREGIDSVDPDLPGIYCAAGYNMESALDIAKIICGKDNPIIIRVSNGAYVPSGARFISFNFYRAAKQIAYVKDKADMLLAECDTIPWNQYAISVQWFHTHYVGSILEGVVGSKKWITRLNDYEPESGVPFRKILSQNSGFYEKLTELTADTTFEGCRIPLNDTPVFNFSDLGWNSSSDGGDGWSTNVLERLGLPVYYSEKTGGASFLSGMADIKFCDEEIKELLKGTAVLSAKMAIRLINRGFKEYIGVDVKEWNGELPNAEKIYATNRYCDAQFDAHELIPLCDDIVTDSMIYHTVDSENYTPLFPGTTVYKNSLGGTVIVFSGTPVTEMNYSDAFSFLNYSRKQQFIKLLTQSGNLPVYYEGTEEMYMKSGRLSNGDTLCAFINIGYDPVYEINVVCDRKVTEVKILDKTGELKPCNFRIQDKKLIVEKSIYTLDPVVLILK